jgi:tetratricopeptide (TPR) repeat protein
MKAHLTALLLAGTLAGLPAARVSAQDNPADANTNAVINEARRAAEAGQIDSAIATYERALTLISGPSKAYDPIIRFNLAMLHAAKGIDAFQADDLERAIASFRVSLTWNPYSRDIRYNLSQALYIQASRLMEQGAPATELTPIYNAIVVEAARVREADPANPNILLILGYTHRNLGEEEAAAAAFAEKAGKPFEIHEVRMDVGASATRLSGIVKNLKLKAGEPVRLRFTMLALTGSAMATSDVEIAAPAVDESAAFAVSIKTAQDVAGWRYDVRTP